MHANVSTKMRQRVYKRDGYRCALCDCTHYIQIHHVVPRGAGGKVESEQNMITLCATCHAQAHGHDVFNTGITAEDMEQYCVEYLADHYAPDWNPWRRKPGT